MKSKDAEKVGQGIMTGFASGIESQPNLRYEFIYDKSEWGIGFSFGKTYYGKWRFYVSLDFLCFCFIVWLGKKKKNYTYPEILDTYFPNTEYTDTGNFTNTHP